MKREEELNQQALIQWFDFTYPHLSRVFFHIPNGGKRNISEAIRFKFIGVRSGVCDLFLSLSRGISHGLYIEMKSRKGKLSSNQEKFIDHVRSEGYEVLVCKNWEEAKNYIEEYLK